MGARTLARECWARDTTTIRKRDDDKAQETRGRKAIGARTWGERREEVQRRARGHRAIGNGTPGEGLSERQGASRGRYGKRHVTRGLAGRTAAGTWQETQ